MGDLMRHHAGESRFRFLVRCQNQTGVHIEEPARQAKALISSESMTLIVNGTCASE
jgi:hypothetical protein